MSSQWLLWMLLSMLTGRPLVSLLLLVAFWWATDRFTLRVLPDPVRPLLRWQRMRRLERELADNPHNRQARRELADLYVSQRRFAKAVEVLRPSLEAGDDEPAALFIMGVALYGSGHADRAERLMEAILEHEPRFRLGAVQLEQGRWRLKGGNAEGARQALETLLRERTGTVEGRVLLARALERLNQGEAASRMRQEAWREYQSSPPHIRRIERLWAWRAQPMRPLVYVLLGLLLVVGCARFVAPSLRSWTTSLSQGDSDGEDDDP